MTARLQRLTCLASGAGSVAIAAALLAGCASPPARFYTLGTDNVGTSSSTPASPPFLIQVLAVNVPDQVARNQLVIQKSATQVAILEQERWASPPADEIRRTLSGDLATQLGTIDVENSGHPRDMPVYRVSVNVVHFDSWLNKQVALGAVWSVRSVGSQVVMTCRTDVVEPVTDGYDALVSGHKRALGQLARSIAVGVRAMEDGRTRIATSTEPGRPMKANTSIANLSAPVAACRN
ncbi:PqiC family protein [Burkholderia sp. LMG 21824]|uniref:PqiC family protein n=1 Tax=Burkholderia sp. LMG 21824 TaxID=3158172 RepID=UPI003C2E01F4